MFWRVARRPRVLFGVWLGVGGRLRFCLRVRVLSGWGWVGSLLVCFLGLLGRSRRSVGSWIVI